MTSFLQYCVNTLGYLRLMTVSDLIDIAILSFLFYKCIGIFQRTNAAKVAKALLLIIVAMWISYQFNLNAISFILNKAVELGLLALVVIFQPEIRRFLERIGSNNVSRISRFFRNETPVSDVEEAIQETVEAYGEMSKNRVGALMVFERETNLSNIISSGTPFQSTVTSELLKNIFLSQRAPPWRRSGGPAGEDRGGGLHAPHVGEYESKQRPGHAPPGRSGYERAF